MKLNYRADIDGLRAIAVMSVVLNHSGISFFSGGFIGVDIFFVISGYLITTILIREVDAHDFSIVRFYERRIRRIYPALFATLFFTLIVTTILYDAQSFMAFSKSVMATTFFFSNVHFWTEVGYFEGDAQLKPLLHTWSLAVEEQYYIFFPLLVMFIGRYCRPKISHILTGIALLSFGWDIYALRNDPSGAFYFAHLRAWELLIGSVLALNLISVNTKPAIRNVLSLVGLGMITAPIFLYSENTVFPGFAAAIPAFGTAFIIYSGIKSPTLINKLLSLPPFVFVGQISYSLYLWHWPLTKFATYYAIEKLTRPERILLLIVIFIISTLSWQFIEKPFRTKTLATKKHSIFLYAATIMVVTAGIGLFIYSHKGFSNQSRMGQASYKGQIWDFTECDFESANVTDSDLLKFCPLGADTENPSFLLWGDSHAGAQATAVQISASQKGVAGLLTHYSGCPPLIGIRINKEKQCVDHNNMVMEYIENHPEIDTILLASRWAYSAEGGGYKENNKITLIDTLSDSAKRETNAILFQRGFNRTVEKLLALHRKVVIISQVPEIKYEVPSTFYLALRTGRDVNKIIAPALDDYLSRNKKVFMVIDSFRENNNFQVIDPWKALCDEHQCFVVVDGIPLYTDSNHLSPFGSDYISHIYDSLFEELANSSK
jgi:peptidoglycan/LPS O-acetylase OafA/YrhL